MGFFQPAGSVNFVYYYIKQIQIAYLPLKIMATINKLIGLVPGTLETLLKNW